MPSDVDFPGEVMNYLSIPNNWPLGAVDADVATLLDTMWWPNVVLASPNWTSS
jgi:hypothetical protein